MVENRILYYLSAPNCFLKLIGSVKHNISAGFEQVITTALNDSTITEYDIYLSETRYIDSTCLGILGKVAEAAKQRNTPQPTLIAPCKDVLTLIKAVRFDLLFKILENVPERPYKFKDCSEIVSGLKDRESILLQAHQTLIDLDAHNRATFSSVVDSIIKRRKERLGN